MAVVLGSINTERKRVSIFRSLRQDFSVLKVAAEAKLGRAVDYVVMTNPDNIDADTLLAIRDAASGRVNSMKIGQC